MYLYNMENENITDDLLVMIKRITDDYIQHLNKTGEPGLNHNMEFIMWSPPDDLFIDDDQIPGKAPSCGWDSQNAVC